MGIDITAVPNYTLSGGGRYQLIDPNHPVSFVKTAQDRISDAHGDIDLLKKRYATMRTMKNTVDRKNGRFLLHGLAMGGVLIPRF